MKKGNDWKSTNEAIPESSRVILNEFLLNLKLANKSQATLLKYRWIIEKFLSECMIPIELLKSDHVLSWLKEATQGRKPRTNILYQSCLSSFFKFCLEEDYMESMVMKSRWRPKIPGSLPKYLNEDQYARVKVAAEQLSLRNRALFLFLSSSGCRNSEVCQLNIEDVNLETRTAMVVGKGKKIRSVHFSQECAIVLKEYLRTRSADPTMPLFMNRWSDRLQRNGVYLVLKKLEKEADLDRSLHPHVMRHSFATNLMARGADLQFIADLLGHTNLNTTRVYAKILTKDIILAYENKMG